MIPFRDNIRSYTVPGVVVAIIAINTLVFLYEVSLPEKELEALFYERGFVPAYFTALLQGEEEIQVEIVRGVDRFGRVERDVVTARVAAGPALLSLLTTMFLHGGWLHLIGNMWYLWIFGDNIEDRVGHLSFVAFYLLSGLIATMAHWVTAMDSGVPTVGASGAIAGVLGAYALKFYHARVMTLVPLFVAFTIVELPALVVLGFWIVIQLVNGLGSLAVPFAEGGEGLGGVAWFAHIGGFFGGMILVNLFYHQKPMERRPRPHIEVVD